MALKNDLNAEVKLDLINYNGATHGQAYVLFGETVVLDTPVRFYYYHSTSTATVDGENVLDATGMGVGRYLKNPAQEFPADWNAGSGSTRILNKPALKKQETFSGTTNGSGTYTVTFTNSYSVAPNIQANIINGTNTNLIKIGTPTTTGVTVTVVNRTDVVGLLPSYAAVSGAAVDVLITEK
jgi:hypothetical protein